MALPVRGRGMERWAGRARRWFPHGNAPRRVRAANARPAKDICHDRRERAKAGEQPKGREPRWQL